MIDYGMHGVNIANDRGYVGAFRKSCETNEQNSKRSFQHANVSTQEFLFKQGVMMNIAESSCSIFRITVRVAIAEWRRTHITSKAAEKLES